MFPVAVGAMRAASGATFPEKNAGFLIAGAGFSLAPIAAHIAVGETKRGLVAGILPVAGEIGLASLFAANKDAAFSGTEGSRTAFGIFFSMTIGGAALGLIDASLAGDRLPKVAVTPVRGGATFSIGGAL